MAQLGKIKASLGEIPGFPGQILEFLEANHSLASLTEVTTDLHRPIAMEQ